MKLKELNFYFVYLFNSQYSKSPIESEISVTTEHDDDEEEQHSIDPSAFETDDDYLLALMLQHEYTNEFNEMMKKYESAVNRNSKRIKIILNRLFFYELFLSFS